jgi:betaine-aldehyde dehydrogenase
MRTASLFADAMIAGMNFGGVKQSGLGREECLEELLSFTQEKNIHIRFEHRPRAQAQ